MSRIFCVVGKSCSGKDTLYKAILEEGRQNLVPVIPYTTRPQRSHEVDGVNYYFVSAEQLQAYEEAGEIVEKRQYHTTQGLWTYFTRKFSMEEGKDYLIITTLEGAEALIGHYGEESVDLVYLSVEDRVRLLRCVARETLQKTPDYTEVCRRFIADQQDFSRERLARFRNLHQIDTDAPMERCIREWDEIYASHGNGARPV